MAEISVPDDFRAIGYSGLFHTESIIVDANPTTIAEWQSKVPCLLRTPGWMALEVNAEQKTITVVRRDDFAILDITMKRRDNRG